MEGTVFIHQTGRDDMYKLWHEAKHDEIICMHSDGGDLVFRDRMYPIRRGVLCFIEKGTLHYTMPRDVRTYDRSKLFCPETLHAGGAGLHLTGAVYAQLPPACQEEVEHILALAARAPAFGARGDVLSYTCFQQLLVYLERYKLDDVRSEREPIPAAIAYIHRHLGETLTLSDICAQVHLSKYYFCTRFRKVTGRTVLQYVLDTRIAAARELLQGPLPIGEVAQRCGFSGFSYFSRVFREQTGCSPSAYRAGLQSEK